MYVLSNIKIVIVINNFDSLRDGSLLHLETCCGPMKLSGLTSQMIYHRGGEPERAMHC